MKRHFDFRSLTLATCAILALAVTARGDDWPLVRNDIKGTGVAKAGIPDKPKLLWKYAAEKDAGFDSTAVVSSGVIYLGDNAGTFHAVKLESGSRVWQKSFAESGFTAGPAVEADRLYVGDMNGAIYSLATADGKELWSKKMDEEIYAGPSINGDDVLFTSQSGTLSCRNRHDGSERWQFHIEAPLRCTPTISGGRAALAGCDSHLYLINVADGKGASSIDIDAPTGSTPAMRDDRVYFGTEGGTFYAINIGAMPDSKPEIVWTYRDPKRNQPIRAAAAVNEQVVVFGGQGKAVYALDRETGKEKWKLPTSTRVESSPVIAGDRVIAATTAGKIYLLDITNGAVKWEYDAGGSFLASPAVVNGRIVIGNTDGKLYCFGDDEVPKK